MHIVSNDREKFAYWVKTAARFCEKRSTRPSWELLRFEAHHDGQLYLHARNGRCELRLCSPGVSIDLKANVDNQFLVGSEIISNVLSVADSSKVELSKSGEALLVMCGSSDFTLYTHDMEFTAVDPFDCASFIMVRPSDFMDLIQRVAFCCGSDAIKYGIDSIYAKLVGDDLVMRATDGRMAIRSTCKCVGVGSTAAFTIPKESIKYLDAFCSSAMGDTMLQVGFTDRVHLRLGKSAARIMLNEGREPPMDQFFQIASDSKEAYVDSTDLLSAVNQIYGQLDQETMACSLEFSKCSCKVRTGKSCVEIACVSQWDFWLSLDCKLLRSFLHGTPPHTEFCLQFTGQDTPFHFVYGNTHFLMMPMQVPSA